MTELNASTGAVVQTITVGAARRRLLRRHPRLGGEHGGNTVTELNASTGAVVQTITVGQLPTASPPTAPTSG